MISARCPSVPHHSFLKTGQPAAMERLTVALLGTLAALAASVDVNESGASAMTWGPRATGLSMCCF